MARHNQIGWKPERFTLFVRMVLFPLALYIYIQWEQYHSHEQCKTFTHTYIYIYIVKILSVHAAVANSCTSPIRATNWRSQLE